LEAAMSQSNQQSDPILDDLHKVRRQMLAEYGGSLTALVAEIQRQEQRSGRTFSSVPIRQMTQPPKVLGDIRDEVCRQTEASGVSPQIIEPVLRDAPNTDPLAPPAS
jgi:hypothetical protein